MATFGWGQLSTNGPFTTGWIRLSSDTASPSSNGTLQSLSIISQSDFGAVKIAIYNGNTLVDYTNAIDLNGGTATGNVVLGASVLSSENYYLGFKFSGYNGLYIDESAVANYIYATNTYADDFPSSASWLSGNTKYRLSLFATYTTGSETEIIGPFPTHFNL